jgi:hypothetical protein
MEYTYLDYFNYYLKEYINELINTFPETQQPLLANYRPLLEGRDDKNDLYVKCFYTKINNFLSPIAKRDPTLFETQGKIFIEGVDLYDIWHNSIATEQTHIAIWKYLQILMILGRKIIPNHKEIVELIQKVSDGQVNIPAKVEKTLASDEKDDGDETPGVFGLGDIASSLGGLGNLASGLGGAGGIGSLLSGLGGAGGAGGIGSLLSGLGGAGGAGGIGSLFSGITEMFNNPEFTNAMSQLSQSMASQAQSATGATTSGDAATAATATSDAAGTDCPPMDEKGEPGEAGASASASASAPPPLFNNALFGDLAKELSETFNFEEMEKDGKPQNIGEALGKFMSGNNPAKLMSLVGKFGSKLQQEVQRGSINPAELLQQTMGAMGGAGGMPQGMADMMQNMARNPQVQQMARNQSTRDRLRAKLDKKNADKQ